MIHNHEKLRLMARYKFELKFRVVIFLFNIICTLFPLVITPQSFNPETDTQAFLNSVSSQNISSTFWFAETLFTRKRYYEAITEYRRFDYFNHNHRLGSLIKYRIGLCYKNGKIWGNAITEFENIIEGEAHPFFKTKAQLMLGRTLIGKGDYELAELELNDIIETESNPSLKNEAFYWMGWALLKQAEYGAAAGQFQKCLVSKEPFLHKIDLERMIAKCHRAKDFKMKSPFKARVLSAILPGAGQMYAGQTVPGLRAFLLNATFAYFAYKSIANKRYWDALFLYYFAWARYYEGTIYHAGKTAERYNQNLSDQILNDFQQNYPAP